MASRVFDQTCLAVYGMLRPDVPLRAPEQVMDVLSFVRPCAVAGVLLDLGDYPGLVAGEGRVVCALMRVRGPSSWSTLDTFEDYDPRDRAGSRYLRQRTPLLGEGVDVWAYHWAGVTQHGGASAPGLVRHNGGDVVASGDWLAHCSTR